MGYRDQVKIDIVSKWDKIKGKAYLIRHKETGEVITFGKYEKKSKDHYIKKSQKKVNKFLRKMQRVEHLEDKEQNVKSFRTRKPKTFKNFKLVQTNKIMYGFNAQIRAYCINRDTGETFFITTHALKVLRGKWELRALLNQLESKIRMTDSNVELVNFGFNYYVPMHLKAKDYKQTTIKEKEYFKEIEDTMIWNR